MVKLELSLITEEEGSHQHIKYIKIETDMLESEIISFFKMKYFELTVSAEQQLFCPTEKPAQTPEAEASF